MDLIQMTALLAGLASAYSPQSDPLFQKMAGHWSGQGTKVLKVSGRQIQIQAQVVTQIEGDRLVSQNTVSETIIGGTTHTRTYVKNYWIQDLLSEAAEPTPVYQLGAMGGAAASEGRFENGVFAVTQSMGGTPELKIESSTELLENSSRYSERMFQGDTILSETVISYVRN